MGTGGKGGARGERGREAKGRGGWGLKRKKKGVQGGRRMRGRGRAAGKGWSGCTVG